MKYAFMMILAMFILCGVCVAGEPAPKDTPPIVGKWYDQIEFKELDDGKLQYSVEFKPEDETHTISVYIANEDNMNDPLLNTSYSGSTNGTSDGKMVGIIKPSVDEKPGSHLICSITNRKSSNSIGNSLSTFPMMEFVEIKYYGVPGMDTPTPASMQRTTEVSNMPLAMDGSAFFTTEWKIPIVLDDQIAEYCIYGVTVFTDGTFGNPVQISNEPIPVEDPYSGRISVLFDNELCNRLQAYTHVLVQMLSSHGNCYGTILELGQ